MNDSRCPQHGQGVHFWLLSEANRCRLRGLSQSTAEQVLREASAGCGRRVSQREITDAVRKGFDSPGPSTSRSSAPVPEWPKRNEEAIARVLAEGCGLADLWEESRVRLEDSESHAEEIIPRLFPAGALLCCGKSNHEFDTKPLEAWRGQLASQQFIVPSPMSAIEGVTQDGKPSRHTLSNTGPRRFLICDFDQGTIDEHAGLLLHLGTIAPLVLALHSGSKSMHGWFLVADQPEDRVRAFFRFAVSLGADKALWTKSQFVRMPDGTRDNGTEVEAKERYKRQTVYFLNYKPLSHESQSL